MTIPLKQVIQAIEEASEVFTIFWDEKAGKTVYLADPLTTDLTEEDEALAAEMENTPERQMSLRQTFQQEGWICKSGVDTGLRKLPA
ncbi:MAG: hypothetical protein V8S81_04440 [Oscillospiraceae bacterium]